MLKLDNHAIVRGVISIIIVICIVVMLLTLIVNPNSLNLEKNQAIGIIIGFFLKAGAEVFAFYFGENSQTDHKQ